MEEITVGPTPVEIKRAEHSSGIHPKLVMVPAPELRQKSEPININFIPQVQDGWIKAAHECASGAQPKPATESELQDEAFKVFGPQSKFGASYRARAQVQDGWLVTMIEVLDACRKAGIHTDSISAPQVGIKYRYFIIDSPALSIGCFNPVITKRVGQFQSIEGCLSFPRGRFYSVPRAKIIKFHYTDILGKEHSIKLRDRYAAIVQHEIDHLDGILMDDNGLPCRG